ncbi:arginyl-tRNA synthetase [Nitzschia inconspicua]|uniref:arginine--tRNA ligase n=1 Tax=Nitzschia inconspicua TaxID=303405 RepID=A0A9K3M976_9STRA|nr:arginyl-tRNA synthetase [Nitzschia inconspicua]
MADDAKGPSKNELKKLAKKAEKAAKKQTAKGQGESGDQPPPAAAKGGPPPTAAGKTSAPSADAQLPPSPKVLLYQASEDDPATLKAVWAALQFNVDVGVAKRKDLPPGCNKSTKKPVLIYGSNDYVLGGGGNAMCKAISLMGGQPLSYQADELCELERTTLRVADATQLKLDALATALEHSTTGIHLVGSSDTMADICIMVSLSKFAKGHLDSWPASVQKFYNCHVTALEKAKAAVPKYLPAPPVDLNDPSTLKVLSSIFAAQFEEVAPDAILPASIIKRCDNPKFGDFQCSAAMPAFASLKNSGKPMPPGINGPPQLAQAVIDSLGKDHPVVQDLRLQGPGFIMCKITPAYLQRQVQSILDQKCLPKPNVKPVTCLVDFSSPNIAKEMHVGHLRSTIIGESVCRILEFTGCKVERVNHVGDWGTQFGMLIQYLKEEYPDFADNTPNITDLTAFYKNAKAKFDEDADFKKASQLNVGKLQSGDEEYMAIWKLLCDVSRMEFQKVYDRLDVTVYEYGESFYNAMIPPVIEEFEKAGKLSIEEGGAKCVWVEKFPIPLMLQKSDGGFGYDSTDMAALKYRLHTVKAQRIIVITDFSQGDHFAMCNQAAKDIGWVDNGQQLQHIGFGTVQGEDGKRFKTRSGDTVRLVDLLDEAVSRMEASLNERIDQGKANISKEEVHEVAEAIGYGAVKYFDLRRNPTSNYKFSYDAMLDTKGDTAVYLLYARVRFESIMAKAKTEHSVDVEDLIKNGEKIVIDHESERKLALQLASFTDVMEATLDDLFPYHICDFVYQLSIAASDFVTQCRVLGSPEMNSRLLLCYVTTMAMQQCFDLLGIRKVKRI